MSDHNILSTDEVSGMIPESCGSLMIKRILDKAENESGIEPSGAASFGLTDGFGKVNNEVKKGDHDLNISYDTSSVVERGFLHLGSADSVDKLLVDLGYAEGSEAFDTQKEWVDKLYTKTLFSKSIGDLPAGNSAAAQTKSQHQKSYDHFLKFDQAIGKILRQLKEASPWLESALSSTDYNQPNARAYGKRKFAIHKLNFIWDLMQATPLKRNEIEAK